MNPRVYFISLAIGIIFFILIIRLIQRQKLDIAYCWLWFLIGIITLLVVIKYDWFLRFRI